jgi:C1A family cysteine protease
MLLTRDRSVKYLPLAKIDGVSKSARERLEALGITTLEELRDLWTYGNRLFLVDYLGDSPIRLTSLAIPRGLRREAAVAGPGGSVNLQAAGSTPPLVRHQRGLALTTAQRRRKAVTPESLAKTKRRSEKVVSLADRFAPARDQVQRSTCVGFASVAYLEYHLYQASPKSPHHSEQFVYWGCKESDGKPNDPGTTLEAARRVLQHRGACLAKTWPYKRDPIGPTEGQGPPREGAEDEARSFTWAGTQDLAVNDVSPLCKSIDQEKPFVLGVLTYDSWDFPAVQATGEIPMPLPGSEEDGGHAVCVVGYELRPGVPGGGAFIFRNSWGKSWPRQEGRFGPGYGTLFFDYVRLYGVGAFH